MSTLSGKLALVTGAGMGIGQGVALELAQQGAAVAVHYAASATGAEETVALIREQGGTAVAIGGNLSEIRECFRVVDEAVQALGGVDILVNNAGITRELSFLETTPEIYSAIFDLNIRGYFFCAQRAVPLMLQRGGGSIINMTSVHGSHGYPNHTAYASTKGAIIAFTRTLAIELAPQHIRVNAIGPGVIEVPRYFDRPGYTRETGNNSVPMGRVGTPTDVGKTVVFLAGESSDFITGQTLYVDGGTDARMGLE